MDKGSFLRMGALKIQKVQLWIPLGNCPHEPLGCIASQKCILIAKIEPHPIGFSHWICC